MLLAICAICLVVGVWYDEEAHSSGRNQQTGNCRGDHVGIARVLFITLLVFVGVSLAGVFYRAGRRASQQSRIQLIINMRPLSPIAE